MVETTGLTATELNVAPLNTLEEATPVVHQELLTVSVTAMAPVSFRLDSIHPAGLTVVQVQVII